MMKILHLYHDIMNLYGDYANVSAMKRVLEKSGEEVTVDKLSLADTAVLADYDFIYIGSGTERNMHYVLEDFKKYADDFKACVNSGKVILLTGNSFEMLGKTITDAQGNVYDGLGLFDFTVTEQNKTRMTADAVEACDFLTRPLVGFINKCSEIKGVENPLFTVTMGLGNCDGDKNEGARLNNLFCTHLTGPVLIKNPHFLTCLAEKLLGRAPESDWLTHERAGYEITLRELRKRSQSH